MIKVLASRFARRRPGRPNLLIAKLPLIAAMAAIVIGTAYAAANTYEVVAREDVPRSSVITQVSLTNDPLRQQAYLLALNTSFNQGSFGIPKKIKLPETNKHFDIVPANHDQAWIAGRGTAQVFVTESSRRRVFGQAVIYMRTNTSTTSNLGEVYAGDVVNIVTTEGWQLGYQVTRRATDPAVLSAAPPAPDSEIIVVLIADGSGQRQSFSAQLTKVGERI